MGQYTSDSKSFNRNFTITKYALLFMIVMNILSTIWVGIYNKNAVDYMKRNFRDDRWTGDTGRGHRAELWERLCITFLVFENVFNCMGIIGALQEHYGVSIVYSILMFLCGLYGAAGKYIRGSVCSYLMPVLVGVVASVYAHQIRMVNYRPNNMAAGTDPKSLLPVTHPDAIYAVPNKKNKSRTPPLPTRPKPSLPLNGSSSSGSPASTPPSNPLIGGGSGRSSRSSRVSSLGRTEEKIVMNGYNHKPVYVPTTEV